LGAELQDLGSQGIDVLAGHQGVHTIAVEVAPNNV
jgi:hypothetical protein